eukprot:TRINITY_DN297_c0_g1_i8.p2 TRINITY_DN297_c0_g1~~TRINITY_DN297_c0_g1_i8.p2  ORF type:complete len:178 (+),score=11.75 TRINITY_DN297_c0_g1_i8:140-673(+)
MALVLGALLLWLDILHAGQVEVGRRWRALADCIFPKQQSVVASGVDHIRVVVQLWSGSSPVIRWPPFQNREDCLLAAAVPAEDVCEREPFWTLEGACCCQRGRLTVLRFTLDCRAVLFVFVASTLKVDSDVGVRDGSQRVERHRRDFIHVRCPVHEERVLALVVRRGVKKPDGLQWA